MRFFSLPFSKQKTILKLLFYLARAEIMISLMPYSLVRELVFRQKSLRRISSGNPYATLQSHLSLLEKICRNLPWSFTCLRQAVALRDCLAANGVGSTLKIGLSRKKGELTAHAWLECCNLEILKNGNYSVLTSFTTRGKKNEG